MALTNMHELFETNLQAMYSAEKRILDMLEEAASDAKEPKLRDALTHHREETTRQVERLEGVLRALGRQNRVVDAPVVEGLFEEKRRMLAEDPTPEVLDLFHVGAAIKTEHVEIAAYETLITLAEQLGVNDALEPLRENLREEQATLEKLTRMAKEGTIKAPTKKEAQAKQ